VARLVRSSHERWNGTGYPDGLAGRDIPLGARIVAVADAFDAMTCERPYSPSAECEAAAAELRRTAGTDFDPVVVEAFCAACTGTWGARDGLTAPPQLPGAGGRLSCGAGWPSPNRP